MRAYFSADQMLHAPQQFMRLGRLCDPADLPSRAEALQATLASRGIPVTVPDELGRAPLERVHSVDYLDYLASAWSDWRALAKPGGIEPGIEVLPNLAPYPSAFTRFDASGSRGPGRSASPGRAASSRLPTSPPCPSISRQ